MDSIKGHWREWGLFEGGHIPWGHMHSNFLQIALERGLPALLLWLAFLFVYARTLWRSIQNGARIEWIDSGIFLGALGGLTGFITSGLVHYNWGDSEVVMVLFLIMGLSLAIHRRSVTDGFVKQTNSLYSSSATVVGPRKNWNHKLAPRDQL